MAGVRISGATKTFGDFTALHRSIWRFVGKASS